MVGWIRTLVSHCNQGPVSVIIAYLTIVSIDLKRPEERQMRGRYCSKSVKHSLGKNHPEPTNQSQMKKKNSQPLEQRTEESLLECKVNNSPSIKLHHVEVARG